MGYEVFRLKENPFPKGGAMLKPRSRDPKENGSIFSASARAREIEEFEEKLIGTRTSFDDRIRCGFIWAEGDRVTGRGMGKTALAIYMKHKVNGDGDYGSGYFDGKDKFLCSYISFDQQMVAKIGLFCQEALDSFLKDDIFTEVSRRTNAGELARRGINDSFAQAVAESSVRGYLEGVLGHPIDQRLTAKDWRYDPLLRDIFLNQTTRCLMAAGFIGGILVVDDIENLTDKSTPKQIETFIKDFGLTFFRADNEVSNNNFYTVILTTHLQSTQKISQAWTVSGLSASYPLVTGGRASLLTRKPDMEQCIDIVMQHLKYYRSDATSTELYPFKRDAIEAVIKESDFHPRRFLSRFNRIISEALSNDVRDITCEFVRNVPEVEEEEEPGIEDL